MPSDQPTGSSGLASLVNLPLELLEKIMKVLHSECHSGDYFCIVRPTGTRHRHLSTETFCLLSRLRGYQSTV
jgi:hypothetical protein